MAVKKSAAKKVAKTVKSTKKVASSTKKATTKKSAPKKTNKRRVVKMDSAPKENVVRVIPLGGVEQVGQNMTMIEYGDSICIVDIGFQFTDVESNPGVDYIIPDTTYLEARKKKIKGVFITHGHLDHIGGIPYVLPKIGNPAIYTRRLTGVYIKKRQEEFPHVPTINLKEIETNSRFKIADNFYVRFFNVTHTIPDSMGVIFETPLGNVVFTGDLKVDHNDGIPLESEQKVFGEVGRKGNNLALLADSTNADVPGFSLSERAVHVNIEKILGGIKGRIIMGTFASLLERMIFVIQIAEKLGRKVVIDGRSMVTAIGIAQELGFLKTKKGTLISVDEIEDYPDDKILVLATGAQGDKYAALMRMATGQHRKIKLRKGDTVILSSSVIPGNEKSVQKLKDGLARNGASVLHYRVLDVHASGHANQDELKWIHEQIKPRFLIPVHGNHQFLRSHQEVGVSAGIPEENVIVPDNGSIIEFYDGGKKYRVLKDKAVSSAIMVDALGTGAVQDVVIKDRQQLAQEGIFVIITAVDAKTGKIRKSPDIISRGFVYLKESQDLLKTARSITRKTIEESAKKMNPLNFDHLKSDIKEKVGRLLKQKTAKRPIVLPVIIEV